MLVYLLSSKTLLVHAKQRAPPFIGGVFCCMTDSSNYNVENTLKMWKTKKKASIREDAFLNGSIRFTHLGIIKCIYILYTICTYIALTYYVKYTYFVLTQFLSIKKNGMILNT